MPIARSAFKGKHRGSPVVQSSQHWPGATVPAASLSTADVQAAINAAQAGDIVTLPAGSIAWSAGVTCSKGILIKGAGAGRREGSSTSSLAIGTGSKSFTIQSGSVVSVAGFTAGETIRAVYKATQTNYMEGTVTSWNGTTLVLNITTTGGSGTFAAWSFIAPASTTITNNSNAHLFTLTEATSHHVGVTGIHVVQGTASGDGVSVFDCTSTTNGKPIILYNIRGTGKPSSGRFSHWAMSRGIVSRVYLDATTTWVNTFATDIFGVVIKHANPAANGWNVPFVWGANDTADGKLYIEDSYFVGLGLVTDWDDEAKGAMRKCVIDNSSCASHGPDTSFHGMCFAEYYDNLFIFNDLADDTLNLIAFIEFRGGTGILTDNVIPPINSGMWGDKAEIKLQLQMLDRSAGPFPLWGQGTAGAQYPCPRQVGMGHTTGTSAVTHVQGLSGPANSNTDDNGVYKGDFTPFYQWNNTGGGNYAGPTIEASGFAQGTPDDPADYCQVGRDWLNSARPGYSKYTYPHPLMSGVAT